MTTTADILAELRELPAEKIAEAVHALPDDMIQPLLDATDNA